MPTSRPKAPPGTFWRGTTLHGRTRVNGKLITWSLQTDNPKLAFMPARSINWLHGLMARTILKSMGGSLP